MSGMHENRLRGKVATFYCINGILYGKVQDTVSAQLYGEFQVLDTSHYQLWDQIRSENPQFKSKDYDFYPRGRVIYHIPTDRYIIYLDRCLDNLPTRALIQNAYSLPVDSDITHDEHYVCHKCAPNYINIFENESY